MTINFFLLKDGGYAWERDHIAKIILVFGQEEIQSKADGSQYKASNIIGKGDPKDFKDNGPTDKLGGVTEAKYLGASDLNGIPKGIAPFLIPAITPDNNRMAGSDEDTVYHLAQLTACDFLEECLRPRHCHI